MAKHPVKTRARVGEEALAKGTPSSLRLRVLILVETPRCVVVLVNFSTYKGISGLAQTATAKSQSLSAKDVRDQGAGLREGSGGAPGWAAGQAAR